MTIEGKLKRLADLQLAGQLSVGVRGRAAPSRSVVVQPLPDAHLPEAAPNLTDLNVTERSPLDVLRQRMQAILGREQPAAAPKLGDPEITLLPFVIEQTTEGSRCRRNERLPASYHVGRIPVDSAQAASAELLSLLALDPALASADPARALYFDTETTGLGVGTGTIAFLIGLGFFEPDARSAGDAACLGSAALLTSAAPFKSAAALKSAAPFKSAAALKSAAPPASSQPESSTLARPERFVLEQLLLRSPADERAALLLLRERIEAASCLVSFNGKTFDLPLLRDRYIMNRLTPPPERPHLDLLHVGRRLHRARIGACRLKSLESEVLGFERDGDIDGADVAPRYAHFLRTGDEEALRAVVDHNLWDVASMAALVGLYGEPLEVLHPLDLLGVAKTLKRGKQLAHAVSVTQRALDRGAGPPALELRAQLAKARGDRARALSDFEQLMREVDDAATRLELAKLYEHFVGDPGRALELVERGTDEDPAPLAKRRARLAKKLEQQAAGPAVKRRRARRASSAD